MQAAPPPQAPPAQVAPPAPASAPATVVTVSQQSENVVIATNDRPLTLAKAGRTEYALLRHVLYIQNTTTVVRPTAQPGPDRVRWASAAYLQRQLCFTSITGLFSCSEAEVTALTDKSAGEEPAPLQAQVPASVEVQKDPAEPSPMDVARSKLAETLRSTANAKFEQDRRLKVDPLLKSAGVVVQSPGATTTRRR